MNLADLMILADVLDILRGDGCNTRMPEWLSFHNNPAVLALARRMVSCGYAEPDIASGGKLIVFATNDLLAYFSILLRQEVSYA